MLNPADTLWHKESEYKGGVQGNRIMNHDGTRRNISWKVVLKCVLVVAALGGLSFVLEHWGDRYSSRLSTFVADQGSLGPLVFIAINVFLTMLLIPQVIFTVLAGALFGWKLGTLYASVAMTLGAVGAFFVARYGVRERLQARFADNAVFRKMQRLSRSHPLHVISLSRIIPVLPFPVTSYLLGITEVRSLPYALLTWVSMLPETVFLASGGHLLHTGVTGRASMEAAVALGVAGIGLGVVVHRMKKKILESGDDD
jgi:uncharacterized membrane protein YdjX (TVP38/TMEM64 family)